MASWTASARGLLLSTALAAAAAGAQDREVDGIPTSLLGTYIRSGELLVYPFFEYTKHNKFDYKPADLGVSAPGDQTEFKGKSIEREWLLFVAYAFSDSLALEFESALHGSLDFTRDAADHTGTPDRIQESGLGDTEVNLRWRLQKETARSADVTVFAKTVFPLQKSKKLLGTQSWEFETGAVITKGYAFGTLAARAAIGVTSDEHKLDLTEWGIDYVKALAPRWRLALSIEGAQADEVSAIGELQYSVRKNMILKMNLGVGLTEKAPNIAPEIGLLFRF